MIPMLGERDLIAYIRAYKDEAVLVVVYTGNEVTKVDLPIWLMGLKKRDKLKRVLYTDKDSYNVGSLPVNISSKYLNLELKPHTAAIYVPDEID